MHVLVTGAGGFSGAEMTLALLGRGHRVTAVVGSTRSRLPASAERLGVLSVITGDLSTEITLPDGLDAIVHAAARSPMPGVTTDDLVRDNVLATHRLVLFAKRSGVRKFVYFSSLSIYGRIETPVVDETTAVVDPDAYGLTKRLGEELLAAEANSMCSLSIRLPGVIGRGSARNWLTNVLVAAREGREIAVFNPNAPFNNAVHVADLGHFACDLIERDWKGFDAVTIGAAGQTPVGEAVRLLISAFGGHSRVRNEPAPKRSYVISSARACDRYGYQPMEISAMLGRFAAENAAT